MSKTGKLFCPHCGQKVKKNMAGFCAHCSASRVNKSVLWVDDPAE